MANKVIIGILVLLVIIAGGNGYYSYTLNRQIDDLSEQLAVFEEEQAARIETVSDELRKEMAGGLSSLENQLEESRADIDALAGELETASDRIAGMEDEISGLSSRLEALNERVSSNEADISRMVLDASEVYERVSPAVVRITNGAGTLGSGFIYDSDSHIVTANHVIEERSSIYVLMYDGRVFKATTVGYCEFSDVAVLKLETNPSVEPVETGDSNLIKIGDPVVAIGSPVFGDNLLGLRDTLTSGTISQVNRFVSVENHTLSNMLQFDAAVNFGNSGGPLFNSSGEVIGLLTARIDPLQGDGIYWAVASNKVKRVADAIITTGSFAYPWIGVGISDLTPQMVLDMSLETANGVMVTSVFTDSPANTAGIETGDIIVAIDGAMVRDMDELTSYLGEYMSPGEAIMLDVIRDAAVLEISVEIGTRE